MLKIHSLPESEKKSGLFGVCVNGVSVKPEFARVSAMCNCRCCSFQSKRQIQKDYVLLCNYIFNFISFIGYE